MKKLQQLCAVATLLFVLSMWALAGNIHTNAVDPPPPTGLGDNDRASTHWY